MNTPLAPAGEDRRPGLVIQPVSDPGLVSPHLKNRGHVEVTSLAVEVALADKLPQLVGLHNVQPSGLTMVPAVKVDFGQGEGGDGHVTHAAVLPVPQPELGVVVGVDVLVQLGVGEELPLQQPQVGPVPVPTEVLAQLAL